MSDNDSSKKNENVEEENLNPKLLKSMDQLSFEYESCNKHDSYLLISSNTDQIKKLKDEINKLREEIAQMRSKLDEKDSIINKKDKIIDELHVKIENLTNKEIVELKQIIVNLRKEREEMKQIIVNSKKEREEMKEERNDFIEINKNQTITIQNLQNDYNKMKEASLLSDLMYQLYRQFILKYENDEIIKNVFITYTTSKSDNNPVIVNIDTKLLHRYLYDDEYEFCKYVKEKFKKAVNISNEEKFSYEYNTQHYNNIISSRNSYCHSKIKDISKYPEKNDFFLHAEEEIGKLMDEKNKKVAKEVLEQIQNLYKNKTDDQEWLKWIETTLNIEIKNGFKDLQDGVILCKLMNHCNPGLKIKFEESKSALKINQNIINYLTAAEELKLCMFDLDDLRFTLNSNNGSKKVEESVLSLQKMVENK